MKKFVVLAVIFSVLNLQAEDRELEKRQNDAIEKFMIHNRQSDGNYSTISLKNWKNEIGIPFLTFEEALRKLLNLFEEHYKNLNVLNVTVIYTNKTGPGGGIEPDFILIQHETKPKKVYRFETRKEE